VQLDDADGDAALPLPALLSGLPGELPHPASPIRPVRSAAAQIRIV
jgi:hypothetical protein